MATKARHDTAGMHGNPIGASGGILALTPEEVAEFIDTREPTELNIGPDDLDEEHFLNVIRAVAFFDTREFDEFWNRVTPMP
jgi:hypothetical protein